jgi:hypothetical protein
VRKQGARLVQKPLAACQLTLPAPRRKSEAIASYAVENLAASLATRVDAAS